MALNRFVPDRQTTRNRNSLSSNCLAPTHRHALNNYVFVNFVIFVSFVITPWRVHSSGTSRPRLQCLRNSSR